MRVERHLIVPMAAPPEAMTIAGLIDGDAINPGSRGSSWPRKRWMVRKDSQEDFLGQVQGLVAIAQKIHRELNDHPLVFGDEIGAGRLVTRPRSAALSTLRVRQRPTNRRRALVSLKRSPQKVPQPG